MLAETIKLLAQQQNEGTYPTSILFGTVKTINPLKVQIDSKIIVGEFLVVAEHLTKYDVDNVENSVDNSANADIEQLARDVINGKYGNGEERKQKLGNLYNEVQARVNEILRGNTQKEEIYIVKKGDCLCNIAKKFNTTVEKIAKDNNITNVDLIYVNQKLIIR